MLSPIQRRIAGDRLRARAEFAAQRAKDAAVARLTHAHAQISEELKSSLGAEYAVMDGEEIFEIESGNVRSFTDTTDLENDFGAKQIRRTASVRLIDFQLTDGLLDALDRHYGRHVPIAFRGIRWQLADISSQVGPDYIPTSAGVVEFTINLIAIARPRK